MKKFIYSIVTLLILILINIISSKIFNLEFEFQWIYDERIKVSEEINDILKSL